MAACQQQHVLSVHHLHEVDHNKKRRRKRPTRFELFALLTTLSVASSFLVIVKHARWLTEEESSLVPPFSTANYNNLSSSSSLSLSALRHHHNPTATTRATSFRNSSHTQFVVSYHKYDPSLFSDQNIFNTSIEAVRFRNAQILSWKQQFEKDAQPVRRAEHEMLSLLLLRNSNDNYPITNHTTSTNACLSSPHNVTAINQSIDITIHSNNETVPPTTLSNVDSLLRLHEMGIPACWLDPVIRNRIIPWSTIAKNYGDTPRIIGLDQCQAFQQANPTF
jgi:hypothetical protein